MRTTRRALPALCLGLLLVLAGCRLIPGGSYAAGLVSGDGFGRITQEELRAALVQYASRCEATIIATADTITAGTQDPVIQRRALRWKLGMIPVLYQAAFVAEPEAAYVALLTIATSLRDFLAAGPGAQAFGEQQALAVDAASELYAAAIELGESFLSEKELARVQRDVEALVRARPIRGDFVAEQVQGLVDTAGTSAVFEWVTAIPLSPFRALQGVDQGAQAIREFNETALHFTRIAEAMPRLVRWNLELFALDLGEQPTVASGLASLDSVSQSASELAQVAQTLPATVQALLDEAERTGASLGPLADSLERAAVAVGTAGSAWGGLVAELSKPPADPTKPSRPFDVREWEQTAARIGTAATELRVLVDSVQAFANSDVLGPPLAELESRVQRVEASSRSLVDLAAWRGLQLILVFFVLLFVYRRVEGWLARRAADTLRAP